MREGGSKQGRGEGVDGGGGKEWMEKEGRRGEE